MGKALSTVKVGQLVTVLNIKDSLLKPKLMEMGLIEGKAIKILFKAPFGDPIAIDVQGYVLSLRLDEAVLVEVEDQIEVFA